MIRKQNSVVNGVALPDDFNAVSVMNNVAFSDDGRYAVVGRDGSLVVNDIPKNGKIEVDGQVIRYKKGLFGGVSITSGDATIRNSAFCYSSIHISTDGKTRTRLGDRGFEIDEGYTDIARVVLKNTHEGFRLEVGDSNKVQVVGNIRKKPAYDGKTLSIHDLDGRLVLPRMYSGLELSLSTTFGDIKGDIVHPGSISAGHGDVSLNLLSALSLYAKSNMGEVDVRGMITEGKGNYAPPAGPAKGNLAVKTTFGDITVRYKQ